MNNRIIKPILALLLVLNVFFVRAQDVDVDSLNSALLHHINTQRLAVGIEDLVPAQIMEDAAQDQANYCVQTKTETPTQKELKKSICAKTDYFDLILFVCT